MSVWAYYIYDRHEAVLYGTAMLRKTIIPKIMRFGII